MGRFRDGGSGQTTGRLRDGLMSPKAHTRARMPAQWTEERQGGATSTAVAWEHRSANAGVRGPLLRWIIAHPARRRRQVTFSQKFFATAYASFTTSVSRRGWGRRWGIPPSCGIEHYASPWRHGLASGRRGARLWVEVGSAAGGWCGPGPRPAPAWSPVLDCHRRAAGRKPGSTLPKREHRSESAQNRRHLVRITEHSRSNPRKSLIFQDCRDCIRMITGNRNLQTRQTRPLQLALSLGPPTPCAAPIPSSAIRGAVPPEP